jgi:hypothetical protein
MTTSKTIFKRCYSRADISGVYTGKVSTNGKNNICSCRIVFSPKPERLPNNPFDAISLHHTTNLPMNANPNPAFTCRIRQADQCKTLTMQTPSPAVNFIKLPSLAQKRAFQKPIPGQGYAVSTFLPLALRALIIALPARVLILSRHPWVRLRLILLG